MPELPEVETMRRGLLPAVGGRISSVEFPQNRYRPIAMSPESSLWAERLQGQSVVGIQRIGKRVLVQLQSGDRIVLQPKMAGLTLISDPPTSEHVRVVIHLTGAACDRIIYWDRRGLGTAHIWTTAECERFLGPDVLGPDALAISAEDFYHRFSQVNRPVKPALLDQRIVAGVGNLYASEILHRAQIDPRVLCSKLSVSKWNRIHLWMLQVLHEAIDNEGSTLSDGTYRNAINGEGGFQHFHLVYDRDGQPCSRCKVGTVKRIVQNQRSTFFCPNCQKRN